MKTVIEARFESNIDRVKNLVETYDEVAGSGSGRRDVLKVDVLRSAVVFLHASLEDILRSVAEWKLPEQGKAVIDSIPLTGQGKGGRAEKFHLGELVAHRGKTIDALISESVKSYLERSNYNDTTEVSNLVLSIGVVPKKVSGRFEDIQAMMQRRHQIVHRADANTSGGSGHHQAQSLSKTTVNNWIDAVEEFAKAFLAEL